MKYARQFRLVATLAMALVVIALAGEFPPPNHTLNAPDGTIVRIERDAYGVPHIKGESEVGVIFGQGFAAAQDRLDQMDQLCRAGSGTLAEIYGAFVLSQDLNTRTMFYTEAERAELFEQFSPELQAILEAYRDGVNTYIDSMNARPATYKPIQFRAREMKRWTLDNSIATMAFLVRNFGGAGGEELDRLAELQEQGWDWLNENRPINDLDAPTTIPAGSVAHARDWHYAGMRVREQVIQRYLERRARRREIAAQLNLPATFGSFAVLASPGKTSSEQVMLLGCPQMGAPQRSAPSITHEVELECPTFHVGGMTVAGLPLVIIGHTETHAWSFTSGVSDNVDVYVDSTMDTSFSKYYHQGEWLEFEVIQDTLTVVGSPDATLTIYRTIHGPVFEADLDHQQVFSQKMTYWKQETDMARAIYGMIKARNLAEFEAAAAINPMSFNLFYAGTDQNIKFWHIGKYQDRSDGVDPRLPHRGTGEEEWGGFIPFEALPAIQNPAQGYLVNWNNKPVNWWNNGDNVPWHADTRLTTRVLDIENYVGPINGLTYENLKDVPRRINDHGTYQQALALSTTGIIDENVVPPGQSGFINQDNERSPHFEDQWPLHGNWQFKDMLFGEPLTEVAAEPGAGPLGFAVSQNYPNPFNPVTTISYNLPNAVQVNLSVYSIAGRLVATLVDERQQPGEHRVHWRPDDTRSGTYLIKITAGEQVATRKAVLVR